MKILAHNAIGRDAESQIDKAELRMSMSGNMKSLLLAMVLWMSTIVSLAAQVHLSGVINTYYPILALNECAVQIQDVSGLNVGDRVLLIQMQGARISTPKRWNFEGVIFGDIVDFGGAGVFQYGTVVKLTSGWVYLNGEIDDRFDVSGHMQLVKVPVYEDVIVDRKLTCEPWNGTVGGVLAFDVSGEVVMDADIDCSALGFRGGRGEKLLFQAPQDTGNRTVDYYLSSDMMFSGRKGEGITELDTSMARGRGAAANGGGGGSVPSAGGGGGSNVTAGGNITAGGNGAGGAYPDPWLDLQGLGGRPLVLDDSLALLFMGGGGGAGHTSVQTSPSGGNGGGIIIIRAQQLRSRGHTIRCNGASAADVPTGGAGGGGGGGTIVLDIGRFQDTTHIEAHGGDGGSNSQSTSGGPGGGGGGGSIWLNSSKMPELVIPDVEGGEHGWLTQTHDRYGSTSGSSGVIREPLYLHETRSTPDNDILQTVAVNDTIVLCLGDTLTLQAQPGLEWYVWTPSNEVTPSIRVTQPGLYRLYVSDSLGCSRYDSVVVVAPSIPSAIPVISVCGSTLISTPAVSYEWFYNGIALGSEVSQSITASMPGMYSVIATDISGCRMTSDAVRVDDPVQASMVVVVPSQQAEVGSEVIVPLLIASHSNFQPGPAQFDMEVRVNATVLMPSGNTPAGYLDNADRVITISGWWDGVSDTLASLSFQVLLGNTDTGNISIDSVMWRVPCSIEQKSTIGVITVNGICTQNGERLIRAANPTAIKEVYVDPASADGYANFSLSEDGNVELFVVDILGRRVSTLVPETFFNAGVYQARFNPQAIPAGNYFCVMNTPTVIVSMPIQVSR